MGVGNFEYKGKSMGKNKMGDGEMTGGMGKGKMGSYKMGGYSATPKKSKKAE